MKFKMVQFATLLIFVMSVVYMAQVPNGFGGEPSTHLSSQWINPESGELETPPGGASASLISTKRDPRNRNFSKFICGMNGAGYIYHRAWDYRGGKMDDPTGHKDNPNSKTHTTDYEQQIYTIVLISSASASANGASGSLDPKIENPEALSIASSDDPLTFQGQGKITLDSPKIDYHIHKSQCTKYTTDAYYWKPEQESTLKVVVHKVNVTEKRTGSIGLDAGGSYANASAKFTHEWQWGKGWSFWNTNGRGFGMRASIGGSWTAHWNPEIKVQSKTAIVKGNVSSASQSEFTATYNYRKELCPSRSSNGTPQIEIEHIWDPRNAY